MPVRNPYAHDASGTLDTATNETAGPSNRYAVPTLEAGSPYNDAFGWASVLHTASTDTPDAERLGIAPIREYGEDPGHPQAWMDRYLDANDAQRHSVETPETVGVRESHPWNLFRAPDNRWTPRPTTRITNDLAPLQNLFLRPFYRFAERNNGVHFSMADHRREYDILGMQPVPARRNTYRLEPSPWDTDVLDVPANVEPTNAAGRVQALDIPPHNGGAYRL